MNEPKRIRDQDSDRVARLLLDAGHFDDLPKKRLDRIVAGIVGAGAAAGAKTAIASSALAAAPIAAKAATPLAAALKWMGVGVLAGLVVSGGAASLETDAPSKSDHPASPAFAAQRDPEGTRESRRSFDTVHAEPATTTPTSAMPEVARIAALRRPLARGAQSDSASSAMPVSNAASETEPALPGRESNALQAAAELGSDPSHSLREELAALALAKSALNQGSTRVALDAVRAYKKRFPHGALGREATYLEMEAEHALGNRGRAVELAAELAPGVTPNAERAREIMKGE